MIVLKAFFNMHCKILLCIFLINIVYCFASIGDRSEKFKFCLTLCKQKNCSGVTFSRNQPKYLQFLGWNCLEECKYECMWKTVQHFQEIGRKVPQFYGKWPFIRIAGMQEPASVVFSFLNGVSNVVGYYRYYYGFSSATPMYYMMTIHLVVSINTWTWSTVFHWRDLPWTEKLDYFCATSLVMFNFYFLLFRLSLLIFSKYRSVINGASAVVLLCVYLAHILYLSLIKFDYGYNMVFNVVCGILYSGLTIGVYCCFKKTLPHFWKLFAIIILTSLFVNFELFDFSPIFWVIDSHSVWHFLTIPLPLLFYSFTKDDAQYLLDNSEDLKFTNFESEI